MLLMIWLVGAGLTLAYCVGASILDPQSAPDDVGAAWGAALTGLFLSAFWPLTLLVVVIGVGRIVRNGLRPRPEALFGSGQHRG